MIFLKVRDDIVYYQIHALHHCPIINEKPHDKPTIRLVGPAETQLSLGIHAV